MRSGVSFPSYAGQATFAAIAITNLMLRSQDFATSPWSDNLTTVLSAVFLDPQGIITADKLRETATTGVHSASQAVTTTANTMYCGSVFLKAAERSQATLRLSDGTGSVTVQIDLSTGALSGQTTVAPFSAAAFEVLACANGWWRVSAAGKTTATTISMIVMITNAGSTSYAGTAGSGILVWGAQLNTGGLMRPYVPTTSATVGQTVDASSAYPLSNLADLRRIRKIMQYGDASAGEFTFTLPAAVTMNLLALVHHNATAADAFRIVLYSDTSAGPLNSTTNMVHDSGWQSFPAPPAGYAQTRPYRISSPVSVRSGYIQLTDRRLSDYLQWQIGALELASMWEWTDVAVDRAFGFSPQDSVAELPYNTDHATDIWSPRIVSGSRNMIDQTEAHTTLLDFFLEKRMRNPFVWMWDVDDSTTYGREAILVTNNSLPPGVANDYPGAKMEFDFIEHLR